MEDGDEGMGKRDATGQQAANGGWRRGDGEAGCNGAASCQWRMETRGWGSRMQRGSKLPMEDGDEGMGKRGATGQQAANGGWGRGDGEAGCNGAASCQWRMETRGWGSGMQRGSKLPMEDGDEGMGKRGATGQQAANGGWRRGDGEAGCNGAASCQWRMETNGWGSGMQRGSKLPMEDGDEWMGKRDATGQQAANGGWRRMDGEAGCNGQQAANGGWRRMDGEAGCNGAASCQWRMETNGRGS
ncbi:hypothetical protein NDU88_009028 [Pleurodeles waltl]|uniref:Uncharacterized protein n=1 Tax=Pleurodeles waltl TaxID=8319 RepID=A0AAV7P115_PLEWA|nr:hypothetical protein NDU88_009028 [Pleurodeles waltl]